MDVGAYAPLMLQRALGKSWEVAGEKTSERRACGRRGMRLGTVYRIEDWQEERWQACSG